MTTTKQRLIDLLAMGRVANLPSVVSNIWFGAFLGTFVGLVDVTTPASHLLVSCLAGSLIYLSGCLINDWADYKFDQKNRPERPIPSGRWKRSTVLSLSILAAVLGVFLASEASFACLVISILILVSVGIYTWIHKKTAWGVIPMGVSRSLLILLGFSSQTPNLSLEIKKNIFLVHEHVNTWSYHELTPVNTAQLFFPCFGLMLYIVGISLFARNESLPNKGSSTKTACILLLIAPVLTHATCILVVKTPILLSAVPLFLIIYFSFRKAQTSFKTVSLLLAGIPLIELISTIPIHYVSYKLFHMMHDDISYWSDLPIVHWSPAISVCAFFLSLLLQRIAPAT